MYVLCTLAVLTLHNLLRNLSGNTWVLDKTPEDSEQVDGASTTRRKLSKATAKRQRGDGLQKLPDCQMSVQPVQRSSALLSPTVMFGTRKTWDLNHAPCMQELWKKEVSLDASSVDFLMSDGDDDGSFLSLPSSGFSQRPSLTAELVDASASNQQLLIQTLQEKVCEFQTRLHTEEVARQLLLRQLQQQSIQERTCGEVSQEEIVLDRSVRAEFSDSGHCHGREEQLVSRLRTQVEELEEKLLDQTQEVERLRSELGATDLEKQLELLEVENQRLKQELKTFRCSELHTPDAAAELGGYSHCTHSQDVESLRREVSRCENLAWNRERRLVELERELMEKTSKVEMLQRQLEDSGRQLDETKRRQTEVEEKLAGRLQECEEELARQVTTPPRVKYVTQTVEVESTDSQKALADMQVRNAALQEQVSVQRQLLKELETQLHESQRTSAQLRTQLLAGHAHLCDLLSTAADMSSSQVIRRSSKILVYEGEMQRAQSHLEAEMQNLEEEKNRVIEEAFIRAESEMKAVHENLAGVRTNLLSLQPALRTLTCDYNSLKKQVQDFPFMLDKAISEAKQEICQVISQVSSTNQELLQKYKREMNLRKKCHNELVRLKGNIRVFCRVRPVSQEEQDSADAKTMLSFDSDDDTILYLTNKGKIMTFDLDKVFTPQATQETVFQEVQSLVTSCIDGFNVCIFAYGQTGSGKTYTMEGVASDPGINQRALRLLFSEVTEKTDWEYKISVSMVEIYNETLRNLLGENPTDKLDIKMNPDGSGQLYVPGLTEFTVQSPEDINRVFELGHVNRATACTNLNEHSSRSHGLLIINVSGYNCTTGSSTQGKLNLVDLAGSERIGKSGAEGSRLREAQCINKSLSALGDVINALRSKHSHVPFRNSRLTYLLQDSLSGDSKTLMMVQVSPLASNMSESVCSLKFAQRVRSIELSSSTSRRHENSSTSSSPTHDSVELDSPPVTPVPLPISRASSAGSTLSSASRTPSSSRRRSQSQLSTDRQVDRSSPLVGDGGQDG
ncbi:kinesin-like protein KIFC3 isoform 3-T3 [Synchiropus picturatus]